MLKDIDFRKVEDVAIAVVKEATPADDKNWSVYLINLKDQPIEDVLVSSVGYGKQGDREVKTSSLRQLIEILEPKSYIQLELLPDDLLGLSNQFWISFSLGGFLYDRKFVFVQESISDMHLVMVPVLQRKGILIK